MTHDRIEAAGDVEIGEERTCVLYAIVNFSNKQELFRILLLMSETRFTNI
jgi:hypothetical protein